MNRSTILSLSLAFVAATGSQAQERTSAGTQPAAGAQEEKEPVFEVTGGGTLPAGWSVRLDGRDAKPEQLKVEAMGAAVHTRGAVSVALYRDTDRLKGSYVFGATFAQNEGSPDHAEPYGLFIGGAELKADSVRYTSFVIRSDGKYQIRRRVGRKNTDVVEGWVDAAAIKQMDDHGKASNKVAIEVTPQVVRFTINGTEVHHTTPDQVDTDGIAGWRLSHNTDLTISEAVRTQK